ncbi:DUF72 domain-containing protein [Deinococcus peraridilitoris]|nr:DUF72 domain-containing protein [Deinococcus peraridilitoris]
MQRGKVYIGTSGWTYPHWRGTFYPKGLAQRLELTHAAQTFDSLELNGSFYSLQRPGSYGRWFRETPDDFVFAVKGGRFITHLKRLRGVESALANFYASGVLLLAHKLGPFLWQLPAHVPYDPQVLESFLTQLPRDTTQAAALAAGHDERLHGRAWTRAEHDAPLRHALEVRHDSFLTPDFTAQLRRHGVALVVADAAGHFPLIEDVTADFVYVRLHGSRELYASAYTEEELRYWAARVRCWQEGSEPTDARRIAACTASLRPRDVYVYFDNDIHAHAPHDARALVRFLAP